MKKKVFSLLVAFVAILSLFPATASAVETGETVIDLAGNACEISASGTYSVSAYNGPNTLTIQADATVTLNGVNITAAEGTSAISIVSGDVILIVADDSTLTGGKGGAGIYVAEGASVTVKGEKQLTAVGNGGQDTEDSGAAGIGGTYANGNSGAITIDGAKVVAKGYGVHGSGIGSGSGKVVGEIKIINGADVTAYGGYYANGVGTTLQTKYGKSDPEGGAAVGGGGKTASTIADITIADSKVVAYGGSKAAGIGANFWSNAGTIAISGGSDVTAQGGSSSAGIGTSRAGNTGVSANIVISGGTVNATGGAYGAGIGAGYNANSLGNGAAVSALPETSITISGGTVNATGGEGGAGIGGGYKSDNVDIDITGGEITAAAGELVGGKTVKDGGAACSIGSGANGSGIFENSPAVEFVENAIISITAYEDGKPAIEGVENTALGDAYCETSVPLVDRNAGTAEDPYRIKDLEDLIWFRDSVNTYTSDGSNQYTGKHVKLTADIDLEGINWEPIGNNAQGDHMSFNGIFDGDGHTISNLRVEKAGSNLGFFACVGNYAEQGAPAVKNTIFHNVTVVSTNGGTHVGGVIGNSGGNTTVSGVKVTGNVNVSGKAYVGGIVGHGYPKISNCTVEATGSVACTYWCSGGMVGYGGEGGTRITDSSVAGVGEGLTITTVAGGAAAVCGLSVSGNYFENVSAANVKVVSLGNGYNPDYCLGYIVGNGEESTLKDLYADNVTVIAGSGSGTPTDGAAAVENKLYADLDSALAAAQDGDTIELLADAVISNKKTIAKAVTIDGNGHSIIADANAVWYTVSGTLNIKNYKTHLLGLNADGIVLKDIVLDNNNNAAGINLYCAQGIVFDNVSIINATKGYAGLTVNGSALTVKTALTIRGNSVAIDVDQGSGVTDIPGVTIEAGTVTDLDNKQVKFKSVAVMDLSGAVTSEGGAYFVARDSAYYYSLGQMSSRSAAYSNGLTLLADVELDRDLTVKGTLDLNGNTLTMAEGKTVKTSGNLTLTGAGEVDGDFELAGAAHTLTAPEGLPVTTNLEGKWPVYSDGIYSLADMAARIDEKGYATLDAAVKEAASGQTIILLSDNAENVKVGRTITFTLEKAGYDMSGDIVPNGSSCARTVTEDGTKLIYTFRRRSGGGTPAAVAYSVARGKTDNGTVAVETAWAKKDDIVGLTVTAAEGYEIAAITVMDTKGNKIPVTEQDGEYVFTMPADKVTVTATFEKVAGTCPACPAAKYTDIAADAWYHDGVHFCIEKSLMVGTGETTFAPDENLSRAMVVQMLYNYIGQPATDAENTFDDVKASMWYYNAVRWGASKNVVSGYGDGCFGPEDEVTIEQAVAVLHNYAGQPAGTGNADALGEHSAWATNALNWAEANGILKDMPYDALTETATRAQMAQMLMNYLK